MSIEPEHVSIRLARAQEDMRPRQIAPGVWSIFAVHKPPGPGELPNRCLLYSVADEAGKRSIIVVNGITPDLDANEPFNAIREHASSLGAEVRHIFNPGPEHHLSLAHYARAFPEAGIYVAAGRIPRVNPELCAMDNVHAMPPGDALPELAAQGFHVHVWDGLMEGRIGNVVQGKFFEPRGTAEPTLFFHEESRTLLNGGHGWWYWGEQAPVPWLARKLFRMKQGQVVWSPKHYCVFDEARCQASARRVLEWEVEQLLDLHAPMDDWMKSGAGPAVAGLCRPIAEGRWKDVPLKHDRLQIPEPA